MGKPANVIVVAKSGGDFTSIQSAIDSINPTAENPYLIKVMPGTYGGSITMKSYIHLQGAGHKVTMIKGDLSGANTTINIANISNVMISDLAVEDGYNGIYINNSSYVTIERSTISSSVYPSYNDNIFHGILIQSSSSITIASNTITGYGADGIMSGTSVSVTIMENVIRGNGSTGIYSHSTTDLTISENTITSNNLNPYGGHGILTVSSSPLIYGNKISDHRYDGIMIYSSSSPRVLNNTIVNNSRTDLYIQTGGIPNISFNIYDTIIGSTGVGMYNVKSDGAAAPEP